jgi:hypothetical protein
MNRHMHWLLVLVVAIPLTTFAMLTPEQRSSEPFAHDEWKVESVMLLDQATTTTYSFASPFRVIRDGSVTLARRHETPVDRPVRIDLTIDGRPVTIYTRLSD